jgi:hypothetical protein
MAIDQPLEMNLEDPDWQFLIVEWLVEGMLPFDHTEARRIACRAKAFVLIDGELYKCGAAGILMRCILGDQCHELLQEIDVAPAVTTPVREHLSEKFPTRFLLATEVADSKDIMRRYEGC